MRLTAVVLVLAASTALAQPDEWELLPPGSYTPSPVPQRPWESGPIDQRPLVSREVRALQTPYGYGLPLPRVRQGALSGKVVYLSAGHGFTWTPNLGAWATQRDTTNGIVEDLVSTETMSQWLIPMLQNAGATVVPIRESDLNSAWDIVDNEDPDYAETGLSNLFADSSAKAFKPLPATIDDTYEPFSVGGNRLMSAVNGQPTASALYTATVPKDGYYTVYVSFSSFSARAPDAHYIVRHAGGETSLRVNQQRHGGTWVLLGRFYFKAGKDPLRGAVQVLNDTTDTRVGSAIVNVSLDAVRFGGGMGFTARGPSGGPFAISGRSRAEESARYGTQFNGIPFTVVDPSNTHDDRTNDIRSRSRFSAWHHETGEDAIYLSWHTNASGLSTPTVRGTEIYVYGSNPPDGTYNFSGTVGSDTLGSAIRSELLTDIQANWDATWKVRTMRTAYFGEIDPAENSEMPAVLMEIAYHDNPADAAALKEPSFRYLATRAIAHAVIKWFAQKDGTTPTLPPEPPDSLVARNTGNGQVLVTWQTQASTSYLYSSSDGLAWDDGVLVTGNSASVTVPSGEVRYFRVAAANAGGESFPSQTVGVRSGTARVLVVNAFDRFDATLSRGEDLSAYNLGTVVRVYADRMNDGAYLRLHGDAIAAAGQGFDSATDEALGQLTLSSYPIIDWFQGRGSELSGAPSTSEVAALSAYLSGGGKLLLSGSSVARDLASGGAQAQSFLSQMLGASVSTQSAGTVVTAAADQFLNGMSPLPLDTGLAGTYPVGVADALTPNGSVSIATWDSGAASALALKATGFRTVFLSFPFETVVSKVQRENLMARILAWFDDQPIPNGGVDDAGVQPPEPPLQLPAAGGADGVEEFPVVKTCGCSSTAALPGVFLVIAFALRRRRY